MPVDSIVQSHRARSLHLQGETERGLQLVQLGGIRGAVSRGDKGEAFNPRNHGRIAVAVGVGVGV
jgi:hypothetical protein